MPSPGPLQRLSSLDQSSPRFPNELANLLHDQGYKDRPEDLRDEDSIFCPPPAFHILPSYPRPLPGYTTPRPHHTSTTSLLSLPSFLPSTVHTADRVRTSAVHLTSPPCMISSWQSDNATPTVPHPLPTRNDLGRSRNARVQARYHTKRRVYIEQLERGVANLEAAIQSCSGSRYSAGLSVENPDGMGYLRVQPLAPSTETPIPAPPPSTTCPTLDPSTPVDLHAPACRRLISHAFSEDEVIPLLETIFTSQDEVKMIGYLRGDDAQAFIDVIDAALDLPDLPPRFRKKCLTALCRICGRQALLPRSLHISLCYDRSGTPLYRGGYADVWKGEHQGRQVAVKVLRVYSTSDFHKITSRFCKEVVTWKTLRHPNVLPLLGVTMGNYHFAMASEWMDNGNINEFVKAHRDVNRFELLKDVARGLIYMHGRAMIHGDLKGANILIDKNGHACLADFGLLTIVSDPTNPTTPSSSAKGGTTRWMSPELLYPDQFGFNDSKPTKESDCYALGMVIYEVLSGQSPFARFKDFIVMRKVVDGERPERPEGAEGVWFTDDLWATLELCWSAQPDGRPTIKTVFECLGRVSTAWQPSPSSADGHDIRMDEDDWHLTTESSGKTNAVDQTTFIHINPDPNLGSSLLHVDYRTEFDDQFEVDGRPWRFEWVTFRAGLESDQIWTAICLIDGVGWSRAEASTLVAAKEEAARKVLRTFRSGNMAHTGRSAASR